MESVKNRVLFICVHNSARSQMAQEYLNRMAGTTFTADSAGLEPGSLNPYVVRALQEEGIDISGKKTNGVLDFYNEGRRYGYVISVCSKEAEERCPIFPGVSYRENWPFEDPSALTGSDEEIMERVRRIRDQIKEQVAQFIADHTEA